MRRLGGDHNCQLDVLRGTPAVQEYTRESF